MVLLLSPAIAGPVASMWTSHLYGNDVAGSGSARSSLEAVATTRTRFTTTRTEDAMDSVLPSAPEAMIKGLRAQNGRFGNPATLKWSMPS